MTKISKTVIAIPLHNGETYLKGTVQSCLAQTVKANVWIFDNASTDSSLGIAKELSSDNDNIRVFDSDENIGRVGNWNKALDFFMQSDFEYIKFLFPGDEIYPECIRETEKVLEEDNRIGALAFPYHFVDLAGNISLSSHNISGYLTPKEITKINLAEGMLLGAIVCNVYAKRAIGRHRFNPCHLSKAEFDIRVLESHGAHYLHRPLAKFLLEAHKSFESSMNPWGFFEFSYIESREFYRISKGPMFSKNEQKIIQNKIIYNSVAHQLRFMNFGLHLKIIALMSRSVLVSAMKGVYLWFKINMRGLK